MALLTIDGSQGEGGGQILRSSLALSLLTQTPFRITRIRAGREKPGLLRQHLASVRAAMEVGSASVQGAELGSTDLTFEPGAIRSGEHHFRIGSAGSTTLVLQTVLLPLLAATGPSQVTIEGGTHNMHAPPFDFLARAFLPLLQRMGPRVRVEMRRAGFYPMGGGSISATIEPAPWKRFELCERGEHLACRAVAAVAKLPRHIAERELKVVGAELHRRRPQVEVREICDTLGAGNAVWIEIESEHVTEVFTGFGERGKPAEKVAHDAVGEARAYLECDAPVGPHLADQLLLPLAMAGAGSFRTCEPTPHTRSNIAVIETFLPVRFAVDEVGEGVWRIAVA